MLSDFWIKSGICFEDKIFVGLGGIGLEVKINRFLFIGDCWIVVFIGILLIIILFNLRLFNNFIILWIFG